MVETKTRERPANTISRLNAELALYARRIRELEEALEASLRREAA